jgi:cell division protein FtsW
MNIPAIYAKGDRTIWIVVLILTLLSALAVYTSTGSLAYSKQGGNTEHYLIKHLVLVLTGVFLMYVTHLANYKIFSRIGQLAVWLAFPLLAITLVSGSEINDAARWLTVPIINATFQTSDFAKLALIMYLARLLSRKQEQIKDFKEAFLPLMVPIFCICGLILPANFSTAAILFSTCLVLLFVGRVNMKYIAMLVAGGIIAFALFIVIALQFNLPGRMSTWKARIENFTSGDSETNYQAEQAKIAIANGGLIGMGPGKSEQRNFLPQAYSDFIFAIILEEGGLMTGAFVVLLYLILLLRVIRMVKYSPQTFATFLAVGCCLMLLFQAFINMAVAVNLFPVTGQALPLVSMGGTSIWFTSISIGIILCVSRVCVKENESEDEEVEVAA